MLSKSSSIRSIMTLSTVSTSSSASDNSSAEIANQTSTNGNSSSNNNNNHTGIATATSNTKPPHLIVVDDKEALAEALQEQLYKQNLVQDRTERLMPLKATISKSFLGSDIVTILQSLLQEQQQQQQQQQQQITRGQALQVGREIAKEFQLFVPYTKLQTTSATNGGSNSSSNGNNTSTTSGSTNLATTIVKTIASTTTPPLSEEELLLQDSDTSDTAIYQFYYNLPKQVRSMKQQYPSLWDKLRFLEQHVEVKDRRQMLKVHENCFVAREAISVLWEYKLIKSRREGVFLLNKINDRIHFCHHISSSNIIQNNNHDQGIVDECLFFQLKPISERRKEQQATAPTTTLSSSSDHTRSSLRGSLSSRGGESKRMSFNRGESKRMNLRKCKSMRDGMLSTTTKSKSIKASSSSSSTTAENKDSNGDSLKSPPPLLNSRNHLLKKAQSIRMIRKTKSVGDAAEAAVRMNSKLPNIDENKNMSKNNSDVMKEEQQQQHQQKQDDDVTVNSNSTRNSNGSSSTNNTTIDKKKKKKKTTTTISSAAPPPTMDDSSSLFPNTTPTSKATSQSIKTVKSKAAKNRADDIRNRLDAFREQKRLAAIESSKTQ